MQTKNRKAKEFIDRLLNHDAIKQLELVDDQGIKVSTHTYDVLDITCSEIKKYYTEEEIEEKLDLFAIIVGVIIHDSSKGTIRLSGETTSHSQLMLKKPDKIKKCAEVILDDIVESTGFEMAAKTREEIIHIVLSHHGKWGKIQPQTHEAKLVYKADMYSAKYHRINPASADKILKLMFQGDSEEKIREKLNCTGGIIRDRLKRARHELGYRSNKQLIKHYELHKKIPIGDDFFTRRVKETDRLIRKEKKYGFVQLIKDCPLIDRLEDDRIFI